MIPLRAGDEENKTQKPSDPYQRLHVSKSNSAGDGINTDKSGEKAYSLAGGKR